MREYFEPDASYKELTPSFPMKRMILEELDTSGRITIYSKLRWHTDAEIKIWFRIHEIKKTYNVYKNMRELELNLSQHFIISRYFI